MPNIDMLVNVTAGHSMFSLWIGSVVTIKLLCILMTQRRRPSGLPLGNCQYTGMSIGLKNA